jgi:hypothetical protein
MIDILKCYSFRVIGQKCEDGNGFQHESLDFNMNSGGVYCGYE